MPWDREQTHATLVRYLLEEAHELAEAIETGDRAGIREELGDLLLQVLFHARIASEDPVDPFTVDDVAADLVAKLVRRHPHVFADTAVTTGDGHAALYAQWDEIKQQEKQRESVLEGIPLAQGALARAQKVLSRAQRAGMGESSRLPARRRSSRRSLLSPRARRGTAGERRRRARRSPWTRRATWKWRSRTGVSCSTSSAEPRPTGWTPRPRCGSRCARSSGRSSPPRVTGTPAGGDPSVTPGAPTRRTRRGPAADMRAIVSTRRRPKHYVFPTTRLGCDNPGRARPPSSPALRSGPGSS